MNRFPVDDSDGAYRAGMEEDGQDMRWYASQRDRRVERPISPFQWCCLFLGCLLGLLSLVWFLWWLFPSGNMKW